MLRFPRLDLLQRLLFLALQRPRTPSLNLRQRFIDRQHDNGRIRDHGECRDRSDGAEVLNSDIWSEERGAAEESAGEDTRGEEGVLCDLLI